MSEPRGGQQMALKSLGAQPVPHLQPQHLVVVVEGCREGGSLKALTLEPGPGYRKFLGYLITRYPRGHSVSVYTCFIFYTAT